MAPPVWVSGQVLTASDVDTWFVPLVGYKTADLSRASTTTPTNDPDLIVSLAASAVYKIQFAAMYACASTGIDLKFDFGIPAGSSGEYVHWYWSGATTFAGPGNSADPWTQVRVGYAAASGDMGLTGHGIIFTAGTASTFGFQWSQNVSNATSITVRKGSFLVAQRIG